MDRFRVTLGEEEVDERQALRRAFAKGMPVEFRGRRVTVWGEFVHGPNGSPASYEFEVQPEMRDDGGHRAAPAEVRPGGRSTTVTLGDDDRPVLELLQSAFFTDTVVEFRGERVRVAREFKEERDGRWVWVFDLEAAVG